MIDPAAFVAAREAKGLSQSALARLAKCSQQLISAIEDGKTLTTKKLPQIATILDVPPGRLDNDFADLTPINGTIPGGQLVRPDGPALGVHASAQGGPGEILVSSDAVDFMPRPSPLQHVPGAYGLLITGDSMAPEFRQGETALVNPHLPIVGGEVYIFYAEREGEARAAIKELKRATIDKWMVSQHNPEKDFALSRKEWRWAHRVIGKYGRR